MKNPQKINGFTLVELSATIVVIGIIGLGMIMTLRTTLLHYSTDYVRQEIRQYGNIVMREVAEKVRSAQSVNFGVDQNGYALIQILESSSNMFLPLRKEIDLLLKMNRFITEMNR